MKIKDKKLKYLSIILHQLFWIERRELSLLARNLINA
jgi:hypothetical protein